MMLDLTDFRNPGVLFALVALVLIGLAQVGKSAAGGPNEGSSCLEVFAYLLLLVATIWVVGAMWRWLP